MKHGKKPTKRQCELIKAHSNELNPKDWLVVKYTAEFMEIVHREDKSKKVTIRR